MATSSRTPVAGTQSTPTTADLQEAIQTIDALSQEGLSGIASIARLAMSRLETPDGCRHLEDINNALSVIWRMAHDTMNVINAEAGHAGCCYIDEKQARRFNAQRMAAEMGGQHE